MTISDLAVRLVDLLKAQGKTVTTVESCTGGLIAGAITSVSGSSAVFDQGLVTYSNAAKTALAGVPAELIDAHGAVSLEVAAAMAEGALRSAPASLALSITGIAGPTGGSTNKPVGMVCFGLSYKDMQGADHTQAQVIQFGSIGRDAVREASVEHALRWAVDTLQP